MPDITSSFNSSEYNPEDAYWMAELALLAYENSAKVEEKTKSLGFTDFEFFDNKGTQGFCCSNDSTIILSFRGTEATHLEDIVSDLRFIKTDGPFGEVHRGFKFALDTVWPEVEAKIKSLKDGKRLFITGHSLGAALATLAAATLSHLDINVDAIYTFGQPKVGNKDFAKEYDKKVGKKHYRFVNNNDIVTRVPKVGYDHVGRFIYISTKGELLYDIGFLKLEVDRIFGRIEDIGKPGSDGAKDHSMVNYLKHLKDNISVNPFDK